jgi:uncharacterized protein YndB with AHSA1/START domain
MSEATPSDPATQGITITRVFDAPREAVFKAWTEPERFAYWFGADAEVPPSTVSMDVRPGGSWRATMFAGPDRQEIQWWGVYHEVVEPERLVFTISDQPVGQQSDVVTVVLNALGDNKTEMVFNQSGKHLPAEEWPRAKQGWSTFFDRMTEHLAQR